MPISNQRPDHAPRAARARLGPPASCLLLAIFAANHSAARAAPGALPYLALVAPAPLRFAAPAPDLPPPPKLEAPAPPPATPAPATPAPEAKPEDTTPDPTSPASAPAAPASEGSATASPPGAGQAAPPEILPDIYARPRPVTVHELLPFFLPAPSPASRATYEIK